MCLDEEIENKANKQKTENAEKKEDKKIIKEEEIEEKTEEEIPKKNNPKKIRKYFKYENGKVKYIRTFSKEQFKKEGLSLNEMKENLNDEVKIEKKRFDKKLFFNKLLIAFIIFSVVFVYFYYIKEASTEKGSMSQNEDVLSEKQDIMEEMLEEEKGEENNNKGEGKEDSEILTKEELAEKIINEVKNNNTKEVNSLQNYLELKGNRVSTISSIKRSKKEKEDMYVLLMKNEAIFKNDKVFYSDIENLLIKSIAMSQEFLEAFENNLNNTEIQEIISRYQS